jgi:glycosyltransferase involved in cell wall biosynthesis
MLDPAVLDVALAEQRQQDAPLGRILLVRGLITTETLTAALAEQARIGRIDLDAAPPDPTLLADVDPYRCLGLEAVPWRYYGGRRVIAFANPARGQEVLEAFDRTGEQSALAIAPAAAIRRTIAAHFGPAMVRDAEARCPKAFSCRSLLAAGLTWRKLVVPALLAAAALMAPWVMLELLLLWVLGAHLATTGLRLVALFARVRAGARPPADAPRLVDSQRLPPVSLLVPLKDEAAVAGQLLAALRRMEYPAPLLDIKLVLEAHDDATLASVEAAGMPANVEVVTVPRGTIQTKPRAMNYALPFCRGEIVGIYDAEDRPDPGQLRAVVHHLMQAGPDVACVQGVLDFYNTERNWLSRCFTIDYAVWFRVVLLGVQRLRLPIPLGGTTVFFRRRALDEMGAWDAHNVTEDADLGMRLARFGYRCEMIATTTEEEACSDNAAGWIRQRSRWLKGYAITWATHMRNPLRLWRELGPAGFLGFQVIFLGGLTAYLALPLYALLWTGAFGLLPLGAHLSAGLIPVFVTAMIAGTAVDWVVAGIALRDSGRTRMLPWILALGLYGLLGSLAAWRALAELFTAPFHWHKTEHGRTGATAPRQP